MSAVERFRGVQREGLQVWSVEAVKRRVLRVEVKDTASGALFTVLVEDKQGGVVLARVRKVTEPNGN